MAKKTNNKNAVRDSLIRDGAKKWLQGEIDAFRSIDTDGIEISAETDEAIRAAIRQERRRGWLDGLWRISRSTARVLVTAVAILFALTMTVIASGPGRGAFTRVFVKADSPKHLEFHFVENEEGEDAVPPVSDRPTWMPKRFAVTKEEIYPDLVHLTYMTTDGKQGVFYYDRWRIQEGVNTMGNSQFSSSELDIRHETVHIGPYEGMLVYIVDDEKGTNSGEITYYLSWTDTGYTYNIQTWSASKEEIIRIAQSIYGTP